MCVCVCVCAFVRPDLGDIFVITPSKRGLVCKQSHVPSQTHLQTRLCACVQCCQIRCCVACELLRHLASRGSLEDQSFLLLLSQTFLLVNWVKPVQACCIQVFVLACYMTSGNTLPDTGQWSVTHWSLVTGDQPPLPSASQHPNYGDCLEVKRDDQLCVGLCDTMFTVSSTLI